MFDLKLKLTRTDTNFGLPLGNILKFEINGYSVGWRFWTIRKFLDENRSMIIELKIGINQEYRKIMDENQLL